MLQNQDTTLFWFQNLSKNVPPSWLSELPYPLVQIELGSSSELRQGLILVDYEPGDFERLSAICRRYQLPVIAIVESADVSVVLEAGAWDYLDKERFTPEYVKRIVHYANRHQRMDEEINTLRRALLNAEMRLNNLIYKNPDGIVVVDSEGVIDYANPAAERLFNRPLDRLLGGQLGFPVISGEMTEIEILRKDGQIAIVEMRVTNTEWDDQRAYLITLHDITQRRLAEEQIRYQADLLENTSDAIISIDMNLNVRSWNKAAEKIYGWKQEEVLGKALPILLQTEYSGSNRESILAEIASKGYWRGEVTQRRKDGNRIHILASSSPLKDGQGTQTGIVSIYQDITANKLVEDALLRVHRAYQTLSDCNQMLIRASDEKTLINDMCRIIVETGGYRLAWVGYAEQSKNQSVLPVAQYGLEAGYLETFTLNWDDKSDSQSPISSALHTGQPQIVHDLLADPHFKSWHSQILKRGLASSIVLPILHNEHKLGVLNIYSGDAKSFDFEEVALLVELANDLAFGIQTIRTRVAHNLAEEQLRYHSHLLQNVSDSVVSTDVEQRILSWNKAAETIYGWRADEAIGKVVTDLVTTEYVSESRENLMRRLFHEGHYLAEGKQRNRDGMPIHVLIAVTLLKDKAGNPAGIVAVNRDITERKQLESDLVKAQLREMEMEKERELLNLKSSFISMVSHEFRTPLTVIASSSEILDRYNTRLSPEQSLNHVHKIQEQAQHMTKMVHDVLLVSKASAGKIEVNRSPIQIENFCRTMIDQVQISFNTAHRFIFDYRGPSVSVLLDEKLLQHILINLLSNAVKYSPEADRVYFDVFTEAAEVVFRIKDEGIGIPENARSRLFEPFFRAGNTGNIQGTGLGLVIVKNNIEAHGGTLEIASQEGVGTTFTVRLPLS